MIPIMLNPLTHNILISSELTLTICLNMKAGSFAIMPNSNMTTPRQSTNITIFTLGESKGIIFR
jgi:hypothetical protein